MVNTENALKTKNIFSMFFVFRASFLFMTIVRRFYLSKSPNIPEKSSSSESLSELISLRLTPTGPETPPATLIVVSKDSISSS